MLEMVGNLFWFFLASIQVQTITQRILLIMFVPLSPKPSNTFAAEKLLLIEHTKIHTV